MIGVTKEEWYLGLRTPVYAPPSDGMRLRVLQSESEMAKKFAWAKEAVGYQARREEEVELERRVHADRMKVGWAAFNERLRAEEVMMGVPTLDVPVLRMNGGEMGSRSKEKATFESTDAVSLYSGGRPARTVGGVASENSYGTANSTPPDLGGEYAMGITRQKG